MFTEEVDLSKELHHTASEMIRDRKAAEEAEEASLLRPNTPPKDTTSCPRYLSHCAVAIIIAN